MAALASAPPGPIPAAGWLLALAEVGAEEDLAWGGMMGWARQGWVARAEPWGAWDGGTHCLRPASTGAPQPPEEVACGERMSASAGTTVPIPVGPTSGSSPALTDLLVGPGGQAPAAQRHAVTLPCDAPDVGVHRHRLRLVQGHQADAVGNLPPGSTVSPCRQPPLPVSPFRHPPWHPRRAGRTAPSWPRHRARCAAGAAPRHRGPRQWPVRSH